LQLKQNIFNYLTANLIASFTSFIISLYLSRTITPTDYGLIGIFQSLTIFLIPFATFGMASFISIYKAKYAHFKYLTFRKRLSSFILMNYIILSSVTLLYSINTDYLEISSLIIIFGIFSICNSIHQSEQIADSESKNFGILLVYSSLVSLLLTVITISILDLTWRGRLVSLILTEVFIFLIRKHYFNFKIEFSFCKKNIRQYIKFYKLGTPYVISVFFTWFFNGFDRIFLNNYYSLHEVGLFSLSINFVTIILIINTTIANAAQPLLLKILNEKKGARSLFIAPFLYLPCIFSIISIIYLLIANYFTKYISKSYYGIEDVFLLQALGASFQGIYYFVGPVFDYYKLQLQKLYILMLSSFFAVCATFLLKGTYSFYAPAIGSAIGFCLLALFSYKIISAELKKRGVLL